MKTLSFINPAVFILLIGVAVIEAVRTKNWAYRIIKRSGSTGLREIRTGDYGEFHG